MKNRKNKDKTKELAYKIKISDEIDKRGYMCGTIAEISHCLKIPQKKLRDILKKSRWFILDKIKGARRGYYIIRRRE